MLLLPSLPLLCALQGTVRYMAPESMRGEAYNEKVDVYAFGLLLWEMLAWRRAFEGVSARTFCRCVSYCYYYYYYYYFKKYLESSVGQCGPRHSLSMQSCSDVASSV